MIYFKVNVLNKISHVDGGVASHIDHVGKVLTRVTNILSVWNSVEPLNDVKSGATNEPSLHYIICHFFCDKHVVVSLVCMCAYLMLIVCVCVCL